MSNTPELTKYFLEGHHLKEMNTKNPLGMKGKLAKAFGSLIREMWMGKNGRTAPYDLKRTLGSRVSRFSGYGQQDSAELLNYILDLIHEDLNRVYKKPYVEMSDEPNRSDAVVAQEYWDAFKARNQSIIVDLMYAQLKSTVTCLTCGRIATAFDPYMSVCLPIVKEEKFEFMFVNSKMHAKASEDDEPELIPMITKSIAINPQTTVEDAKTFVKTSLGMEQVDSKELICVSVRRGQIEEIHKKTEKLIDIDTRLSYQMFYHVPREVEEPQIT